MDGDKSKRYGNHAVPGENKNGQSQNSPCLPCPGQQMQHTSVHSRWKHNISTLIDVFSPSVKLCFSLPRTHASVDALTPVIRFPQ